MDMEAELKEVLSQDELFKIIYDILTGNADDKKKFLADPERVLSGKKIKLESLSLALIKKICTLNFDSDPAEFNEKLVLCSSSGY